MKVPPLIAVPAGTVVRVVIWQTPHPIFPNRRSPDWAAAVAANPVSRGGTFEALINSVKAAISAPLSSESGTVSYVATDCPFGVVSVGTKGLVIYLVAVGIARKGQQAGMLGFPSE